MKVSGLIPARFLVIISHLVIIISIIPSRNKHVTLGTDEDKQFIAGLSLSIIFMVFELASFLCGVTMFKNTYSLIVTCAHVAGSGSLSYFVNWHWKLPIFWYIFAGTIVLPTVTELIYIILRLGFRQSY